LLFLIFFSDLTIFSYFICTYERSDFHLIEKNLLYFFIVSFVLINFSLHFHFHCLFPSSSVFECFETLISWINAFKYVNFLDCCLGLQHEFFNESYLLRSLNKNI
jgi:hypothetical protein